MKALSSAEASLLPSIIMRLQRRPMKIVLFNPYISAGWEVAEGFKLLRGCLDSASESPDIKELEAAVTLSLVACLQPQVPYYLGCSRLEQDLLIRTGKTCTPLLSSGHKIYIYIILYKAYCKLLNAKFSCLADICEAAMGSHQAGSSAGYNNDSKPSPKNTPILD